MSEAIVVDLRHAPSGLVLPDLSHQTSIRNALDWLLTQSPPYRPLPPIAQDEYYHDVIFEHPQQHLQQHWIVYDST